MRALETKIELERLEAKTYPKTLVSVSGPANTIRVLPRGNWLNESGEIVGPNTPVILPKLHVADRVSNRLDLARWLMKEDNPLPARVVVNRLWTLFLGQGLVNSLNDFGAQGAWPTHPELLDWLAVELHKSGWNIRHVIRLLLLSSTYRQTSVPQRDSKIVDPTNQLLGRQARFRLQAEMLRDQVLSISGLLYRAIGGPSAMPYQPDGYWEHLLEPWQEDVGPYQYRRGLYTFWKRSALHPSLLAFDAPTREECTVTRNRSNTPQQALVLLNDPTYVEAARVFAQKIILQGGPSQADRIRFAIREALQRPARQEELEVLASLVQQHLAEYHADPTSAQALVNVGRSSVPTGIPLDELAAWTSVAQVIMNLHEFVTRY